MRYISYMNMADKSSALRRCLSVSWLIVMFLLSTGQACAVGGIRDAEIESTLKSYLAPLLEASGTGAGVVKIYILNDPEINAFVSGGSNIFIHTGLILEAKSAETLIGVMAHELGHITGGHIIKRGQEEGNILARQIISLGLSAAAAASGQGQAAVAILSAGQQVSQRSLLSFTREQEQYADQRGLEYLRKSGIPANGLLSLLEMLRRREDNYYGGETKYLRTHPLSKERIAHIRGHLSSPAPKVSPDIQKRFSRMQAKLRGFLLSPDEALSYYTGQDSLEADYARAVAWHRKNEKIKALEAIKRAEQKLPKDPYIKELEGQILFESGDIKAAIAAYTDADKLMDEPLIKLGLAQALLADDEKASLIRALNILRGIEGQEAHNPMLWQLSASGEGKAGNIAKSRIASAEYNLIIRNYDEAIKNAHAVKNDPKAPSPLQIRASDIERFALGEKKNERK